MIAQRPSKFVAPMILMACVLTLPASRLAAQEGESASAGWQQPPLPETFSALAIVMGNIATGRNERIMIRITRWTTPEERDGLIATIIEKPDDDEALRNALQKQEETGFIRGSTVGAGWPSERLRYAWQWVDEETGNRRIVLGLDRPIGGLELWRQSRALQYQITVIVLDVDKNGEGTGLLSVGTQINYDPDLQRFVVEYYSSEPVRLTTVRKTS
jgi:hypothetical protein